jgi:hypothetical protein
MIQSVTTFEVGDQLKDDRERALRLPIDRLYTLDNLLYRLSTPFT